MKLALVLVMVAAPAFGSPILPLDRSVNGGLASPIYAPYEGRLPYAAATAIWDSLAGTPSGGVMLALSDREAQMTLWCDPEPGFGATTAYACSSLLDVYEQDEWTWAILTAANFHKLFSDGWCRFQFDSRQYTATGLNGDEANLVVGKARSECEPQGVPGEVPRIAPFNVEPMPSVPEVSTVAMFATGLAGLILRRRVRV